MIDETGLYGRILGRLKANGLAPDDPRHKDLVARYKRTALMTSSEREAEAFFDAFCAELEVIHGRAGEPARPRRADPGTGEPARAG